MSTVGKYYKIYWYPNLNQGRIIKFHYVQNQGKRLEIGTSKPDDDNTSFVDDFTDRLSQSISRTKSRIFELAGCNPWEWFFTGTLNPDWHNSYNLGAFRTALSQYIRDCRKKYKTDCAYLLIPEQHKSGAWHVHGLLHGFPLEVFRPFQLTEKLPYKLLQQLKRGEDVREWVGYSKRFGFTTVTPIRSQVKTTSYITKYITKDCYKSAVSNGNHLFYSSQGLNGKTLLYEGNFLPSALGSVDYTYSNDYVSISSIDTFPYGLSE